MNRKQEVAAALATLQVAPCAAPVHTTAGYDAMYVRVVEKVGAPSVEDACHAPLQPLPPEELLQRCPCRTEHARVKRCLVGHGQRVEAIGDGEYHMEVFDAGYDLFTPHPDPCLPLFVLALWAMAVAATVVADTYFPAIRARVHMSSKPGRTAHGHCLERLAYLRHWAVRVKKNVAPLPDDLPYLMLWAHHRRLCQPAKHNCAFRSLPHGGKPSWPVWSGARDGLSRFGCPHHIPKGVWRKNDGESGL